MAAWRAEAKIALLHRKEQERTLKNIAMYNRPGKKDDPEVSAVVQAHNFETLLTTGGVRQQPVWFLDLSGTYRHWVNKKMEADMKKKG